MKEITRKKLKTFKSTTPENRKQLFKFLNSKTKKGHTRNQRSVRGLKNFKKTAPRTKSTGKRKKICEIVIQRKRKAKTGKKSFAIKTYDNRESSEKNKFKKVDRQYSAFPNLRLA